MEQFFYEVKKVLVENPNFVFTPDVLKKLLKNSQDEDYSNAYNIKQVCEAVKKYSSDNNVNYKSKIQGKYPKEYDHMVFNIDEMGDIFKITKLYLPMKYQKSNQVLNYVYRYLIENNIRCETKVATYNVPDNFVIRIYDQEQVEPFLDFCNKPEISDNLNDSINPFVAKRGKVGVVQDSSKNSFNSSLYNSLSLFINDYVKGNIQDINVELFQDYLVELINKEEDKNKKFNYICISNSVNCIKNDIDPFNVIQDSLKSGLYNI